MKYSDMQRIAKIRQTTEKLLSYIEREHITTEKIMTSEPLRWAITTPLYNIGEQAYHLSERYPDIPWSKISGMRHRLVHDYDNTNWSLICVVVFEVLPGFLKELKTIEDS